MREKYDNFCGRKMIMKILTVVTLVQLTLGDSCPRYAPVKTANGMSKPKSVQCPSHQYRHHHTVSTL